MRYADYSTEMLLLQLNTLLRLQGKPEVHCASRARVITRMKKILRSK